MRLIDADAFKQHIHDENCKQCYVYTKGNCGGCAYYKMKKYIEEYQTVDHVKHGRWILHDVCCEETYECSCCHYKFIEEYYAGCDLWHFCPECGAKMDQKLRFSSLGEDME